MCKGSLTGVLIRSFAVALTCVATSCDSDKSYFINEPSGILFIADDENGMSQLFSIESDGSGFVKVTADPDNEILGAAWSHDYSFIALLSSERGNLYGPGLHIVRSDGTGKHLLLQGSLPNSSTARLPMVWSPTSDMLLFQRLIVPEVIGVEQGFIAEVKGTFARPVSDEIGTYRANDWSDDGERIIGSVNVNNLGNAMLVEWKVSDGSVTWTYGDSLSTFYSPIWSPDESKIVLSVSGGGRSNLHVLDLDTGNREKITDDSYDFYEPLSWTRDGVLVSGWTRDNRGRRIQRILIVNPESGETEDISPMPNVTNRPTSW